VRLGLSDGGEAAGPVMVLYCIAERADSKAATPATKNNELNFEGRPIGPLYYDVDWGGARVAQHRNHIKTQERIGRALSAVTVPLRATGKARLTVRDGEGGLIAVREIVIRQRPRPVWHAFARSERINDAAGFVVADDPMPAVIRINGYASRGLPGTAKAAGGTTQPSTRPSPLPFDVATEPHPTLALSLALEGGAFVVKSPTATFSNRRDDQLLARWWVNGAAVSSEVMPPQRATQQTGQVKATDTLTVRFGLPDFLGDIRAGDRIGLQVLHAPDGFEPAPSGIMQLQQQVIQALTAHDEWPMLSNRIDFELTEPLLREKATRSSRAGRSLR
jgi:hypothetical protein